MAKSSLSKFIKQLRLGRPISTDDPEAHPSSPPTADFGVLYPNSLRADRDGAHAKRAFLYTKREVYHFVIDQNNVYGHTYIDGVEVQRYNTVGPISILEDEE